MLSIYVNPEECFETYRNKKSNKKHKEVRKGTSGITFYAFPNKILSLSKHEDAENIKCE